MTTNMCGEFSRPAAVFGHPVRERHAFGPVAFIAPVQDPVKGTGVSSAVQLAATTVMDTPAADGAVSGLRPWGRHRT